VINIYTGKDEGAIFETQLFSIFKCQKVVWQYS